MAPIIEDWVSDSEDESEPNDPQGVDHLIKDCNFHAKPKPQPTPRNSAHRGYDKQYASSTKKYPQKHIVSTAVLTKSKPVSVTAARPVSAAVPKIMATKLRHARSLHTKTNSIIRRHKTRSQFSKTSNSSPKVTTAQAQVVSVAKGKRENGGCSWHMTGNMSYLSDFQELNGGYVTFGGNPKGGKISGKGKIKTDFKLPNENQVLLRVPREKNMYNVNLKDIVPSEDLTCLFAKNKEGDATFDGKEHDAEKPESTVNLSLSSSALSGKQDDMTKKKDKGKSRIDYFTGNRDFNADFEDYSKDSSNDVSAAGPIVPTAGKNYSNSTNSISVAGFEDPDHADKVYKVVKALYGLHQAPRAWYETLATYLLENGFHRGQIDQILFIKKQKGDILLVQIYVDDIIFDKFKMNSMRELTFFLGLQVKQKEDGMFINQDKYVVEILKKFGLTQGKLASTPTDTKKPLLKDPNGKDVDVYIYRSMISSLMYLTSSRPDIMFAKVVVTEATIRDALHLDDAEGVDCLPNEEIFTTLARMVYEKPYTKLTFYKAFFSSQWKFFIHTILQSMSAIRTSWNEFSSTMASVVICLSTGDLSTHSTKYIAPALTQKVFANMRRVGKGCSRVETPLFEGMLVAREPKNQGDAEKQGNAEGQGNDNNAAKEPVTAVDDVADQSIQSPTPLTPPPQQP
nr:putative ribonuclease H-like domain-containing protein [Tanacetum cinerariifolium]